MNLENFTCQICRESLLVHSLTLLTPLTVKLINRDKEFQKIVRISQFVKSKKFFYSMFNKIHFFFYHMDCQYAGGRLSLLNVRPVRSLYYVQETQLWRTSIRVFSLKYLLYESKYMYKNVQCALMYGNIFTFIHKPWNDVIYIFICTNIQM